MSGGGDAWARPISPAVRASGPNDPAPGPDGPLLRGGVRLGGFPFGGVTCAAGPRVTGVGAPRPTEGDACEARKRLSALPEEAGREGPAGAVAPAAPPGSEEAWL